MIRSRVKTFGYWLAICAVIAGFVILVVSLVKFYSRGLLGDGQSPWLGIAFFYLVILLLLTTYGKLLWDCHNILIDPDARTIQFTNRFTRQAKTFDFGYFDGSLIINEPIKGGFSGIDCSVIPVLATYD